MRKGTANSAEPLENRVIGKESGKEASKEAGKDLGKEAGTEVCQEARRENSPKELDNTQKTKSVMDANSGPLDPPEGGCEGGGVGPVAGVSETWEIPGAVKDLETWAMERASRGARHALSFGRLQALDLLLEWLKGLPKTGFQEADLLPRFTTALGLSWEDDPRRVFRLFLILRRVLRHVARLCRPVDPVVSWAVERLALRYAFLGRNQEAEGFPGLELGALPGASGEEKCLPEGPTTRQVLIQVQRVTLATARFSDILETYVGFLEARGKTDYIRRNGRLFRRLHAQLGFIRGADLTRQTIVRWLGANEGSPSLGGSSIRRQLILVQSCLNLWNRLGGEVDPGVVFEISQHLGQERRFPSSRERHRRVAWLEKLYPLNQDRGGEA